MIGPESVTDSDSARLLLQDECLIKRDNWLRDFIRRFESIPKFGLVGWMHDTVSDTSVGQSIMICVGSNPENTLLLERHLSF